MMKIKVDKLPKQGLVMAYFKERLFFSPYFVREGDLVLPEKTVWDSEEPYECHFFDGRKEYRRILRAFRGDIIEQILTEEDEAQMQKDLVFTEEVLVKKEYASMAGIPEKLRIVNRYEYSENDTLVLRNYRLALSRFHDERRRELKGDLLC